MKLLITPKVLAIYLKIVFENHEKVYSGSMLTVCVEEREIKYML